ncbi:Class I SAM-dependent methyltransferase [uncultured Gammaproteobacteria bacterium]
MSECQVCGGTEFAPLVTQGRFEWCRCRGCGLARLKDMPSDQEAREFQDHSLAEGYIGDYRDRAEKKLRRFTRRVRRMKRRMPGPNLLDVGSNLGFFVEAARRQGLVPVGVEINPELVEAARRQYPECSFIASTIEDADFGGRLFDGANCSEVIEHVPECRRLITRIAELLRPGAILYLTTPHIREYTRGFSPARWRDFNAPDHKLYFDNQTITRLLTGCGFTDVRIEFSFFRGIKLFARRA